MYKWHIPKLFIYIHFLLSLSLYTTYLSIHPSLLLAHIDRSETLSRLRIPHSNGRIKRRRQYGVSGGVQSHSCYLLRVPRICGYNRVLRNVIYERFLINATCRNNVVVGRVNIQRSDAWCACAVKTSVGRGLCTQSVVIIRKEGRRGGGILKNARIIAKQSIKKKTKLQYRFRCFHRTIKRVMLAIAIQSATWARAFMFSWVASSGDFLRSRRLYDRQRRRYFREQYKHATTRYR